MSKYQNRPMPHQCHTRRISSIGERMTWCRRPKSPKKKKKKKEKKKEKENKAERTYSSIISCSQPSSLAMAE